MVSKQKCKSILDNKIVFKKKHSCLARFPAKQKNEVFFCFQINEIYIANANFLKKLKKEKKEGFLK